jgi:Protein of unknown function (DUF2786)
MSIAKKVAAIIAKAKSTTNSHEAAIFMAKAEELMRANGLDLNDIESADDPLALDDTAIRISRAQWQATLIAQIALYYHCAAIRVRPRTGGFWIILTGKESARTTVRLMWPFVLRSVGKEAAKAHAENPWYMSLAQYKKSIATMLAVRVARLRKDRDGPETSDLYKRSAELMREHAKDAKTSKVNFKGVDPRHERHAANISLNLQADNSSQSSRLQIEGK